MLLTKEVEITLNSFNVAYYESLGYKIPLKRASESNYKRFGKEFVYDFKTPIIVKVEDLQEGSHVKVDVLCDYCKKNIITMQYRDYLKRMKIIHKHACVGCSCLKSNESNLVIYNVKNVSQLDEIKRRMVATNIERYGTIAPAQNNDILKKMKTTSLLRYGVENPMQCHEIRKKLTETLCLNGTHKTSKQQVYLFDLYNKDNKVQLNYPISYYATDICLTEENLVIEYDGGGHRLREILGQLTKDEFDKKEIIRNNIIKREGYNQMRIISLHDYLPSDTILFQMLSDARNYFSTTSHSWVTYDIDQSLLFDAENKQGTPYDFGELRTIKDSDLQTISNN